MAAVLTAVAGAACGTAAVPAPSIQVFSRDDTSLTWVGTGTGTLAAGVVCTFTFGGTYSSVVDDPAIPKVLASFIGANAHTANFYVSSVTATQVVISCSSAIPANSLPATAASGMGIVLHMDL